MGIPTITAQQAYNLALALMKERDSTDYSTYALGIINILQGELYPFSDTYTVSTAGTRPVLTPLNSLSDVLLVDDFIGQSVLPYGLAAQLLQGEDDAKAAFFQQRYEELRDNLACRIPSSFAEIEDEYGGIEYGEYSAW